MRKKQPLSPRRGMVMVLIAAVVFIALFIIGTKWEDSLQPTETRGDLNARFAEDTDITVDGVGYRLKKNLSAVLVMGIDRTSQSEIKGYRNGGQADFLQVVITHKSTNTLTLLPIDRNTIADVIMVDVFGREAGVRKTQINLSHGYGDGKKQSCERTLWAVKNLLWNVPIEDYIAVNMDGIAALNDLCGGVTLTMDEDLTQVDPGFELGATITMTGAQAEKYTRARMSVGQGTNEERMRRQSVYISALVDQMKTKLRQKNFVGRLFDDMEPYTQTSMNRGEFVNRVWEARDLEVVSVDIPGEHILDEWGFEAFYPDEDALRDIVLTLFYDKIQRYGA